MIVYVLCTYYVRTLHITTPVSQLFLRGITYQLDSVDRPAQDDPTPTHTHTIIT